MAQENGPEMLEQTMRLKMVSEVEISAGTVSDVAISECMREVVTCGQSNGTFYTFAIEPRPLAAGGDENDEAPVLVKSLVPLFSRYVNNYVLSTIFSHSCVGGERPKWIAATYGFPNCPLYLFPNEDQSAEAHKHVAEVAPHSNWCTARALHPVENVLALGSWDSSVSLLAMDSELRVLHTVGELISSTVKRVEFSPDGRRLLVVHQGETYTLHLYSVEAGSFVLERIATAGGNLVAGVTEADEDEADAPADSDEPQAPLSMRGSITTASFSPNGNEIAVGYSRTVDGNSVLSIVFVDAQDLTPVRHVSGFTWTAGLGGPLVYMPSGEYLLAQMNDGHVIAVDVAAAQVLGSVGENMRGKLALAADGSFLVQALPSALQLYEVPPGLSFSRRGEIFLQGLSSPTSSISQFLQASDIYDRNVVGVIFSYMHGRSFGAD